MSLREFKSAHKVEIKLNKNSVSQKKKYSGKLKTDVVKLINAGKLTVEKAADVLGLSESTLYKWSKEGLPKRKYTRRDVSVVEGESTPTVLKAAVARNKSKSSIIEVPEEFKFMVIVDGTPVICKDIKDAKSLVK